MGNRVIRSGIYQWVNEINGKSYIGSSKDLTARKNNWKNNFQKNMRYKSILKDAVIKYGVENFTFIILEECEPTKEILEERENFYFELLKPEYNILQKAYSSLGMVHSEETIEKIRQAHSTEEVKQVHRDYQTQKMADPSNREKISEAMKEYRIKVPYQGSNVKGIKRSEQTKQNMSIAIKNSEKHKASIDRKKGKTTSVSSSGEYGIQWSSEKQKWTVKIDDRKYGNFKTIEEAIIKRDEIVALPPEQRQVAAPKLPSSGERNIIWENRNNKWMVRIGTKQYGLFHTIEEAVQRRNSVNIKREIKNDNSYS